MPEPIEPLGYSAEEQDGDPVRISAPNDARGMKPLPVGLDEFELQRRANREDASWSELGPSRTHVHGVETHTLLASLSPDRPGHTGARTEASRARRHIRHFTRHPIPVEA
jgi:hypothetical protein